MSSYQHDLPLPSAYTQTLPYSDKRHFESPRVHIPPPNLDYQDGKPSFNVSRNSFEQTTGEYGNPTFLNSLKSCHNLQMNHTMLSWRYEMRRAAQPVLPYVLLGPSSAAKDLGFLKDSGITLMVAVRSTRAVQARPSFLNPATFLLNSGITTLSFDFDTTYDFVSNLRPTIKAINDHLEQTCTTVPVEDVSDIGGKVLVFCESGNDRSSVLVAAYLMVIHGVNAFSAIHIIQSQRFCITMSDDMKNVLLDLQHIIEAERMVSASNATTLGVLTNLNQNSGSPVNLQKPIKRNIDDMDTSDDEMGISPSHDEVFHIRQGIAPFTDAAD